MSKSTRLTDKVSFQPDSGPDTRMTVSTKEKAISTKVGAVTKKTTSAASVKSSARKVPAHSENAEAAIPPSIKADVASSASRQPELDSGQNKQTNRHVSQNSSNISGLNNPSHLLRRGKTTQSALSHLEKGIACIHRKEFRQARVELQAIIERYPHESSIVVRAHSYLDICTREEGRQKKTPATHDQIYAMGVLEHNQANYDKAIAYFRQSLEKHPRADYIYYSIAASLALKGALSESLEHLRQAVELNGESRVHARNDPDFSVLGNHEEFQKLVAAPSRR